MANWNTLKTAVADVINANGNQAITGQLLQNVLNNIITNVGENAAFAGIATLDTNPGAPDGPVFYLTATAGTYPNFNGIEVQDGEVVILLWNNNAWSKKVTGFATQEKLSELGSKKNYIFLGGQRSERYINSGYFDFIYDANIYYTNIQEGYFYFISSINKLQRTFSLMEKSKSDPLDLKTLIKFSEKERIGQYSCMVSADNKSYIIVDWNMYKTEEILSGTAYDEGVSLNPCVFCRKEFDRIYTADDLDDIKTNGVYKIYGAMNYLLLVRVESDFINQVRYYIYNNEARIEIRAYENNTQSWTSWKNVIKKETEEIRQDINNANKNILSANENIYNNFVRNESGFRQMRLSNIKDGIKPLKILFVGNSFAVQSTKYIPNIFERLNKKIILGVSYAGGATLQYYDNNKDSFVGKQIYRKYKDGWVYNDDEFSNTLMDKLNDEDWDFISLQQGSAASGLYSTYEPYYQNLINWLNNFMLSGGISNVWLMSWAWSDNKISSEASNLDGGNNNEEMFANILSSTNSLIMDYGVDLLIYNGLVVQNLLSEYTQNEIWIDGQHLTSLGVFAVSLMTSNIILKYCFDTDVSDILFSEEYSISESDFNKIKDIVKRCSYSVNINGGNDYTKYVKFKSHIGNKYNVTLVSLDNPETVSANLSVKFRAEQSQGSDVSNSVSFSKSEIGVTKQIRLTGNSNFLFVYTGFKDINAVFKLSVIP